MVNYESGPALARCVEGLRAEGPAELVVVDNGSRDGSVEELRRASPRSRWWSPGATSGTGRRPTVGVAATTAPAVLVCNPDLEVRPGALAALAGPWTATPGAAWSDR